MTLRRRINELEQARAADLAGCPNCRPLPAPVEVFDGEPDPPLPPCRNPSACPRSPRLIVIHHHGSVRGVAPDAALDPDALPNE